MSDTVQQIKERLNIVDVIMPYVRLTKAGKYWKGLSPFNKEKTPSFYVSPDRGLYHCFSSGKGGDMFTFVEEMERVDFKGALKILAEKAGVQIVYEKSSNKDVRDRLYAVLEAACEYFVATLANKKEILAYLAERSVTPLTIEAWSLGYAPNEWRALTEHLRLKGYSDAELRSAGLAKTKEGAHGLYDTFRGRIMFPIRDASGRVIAFTGRIYEDDPAHPQAKYLNSPETEIFEKSKVLYGVDIAKGGIRNLNCAILVEGQFDLLMAHQAGYTNTLALSGTAFTDNHARAIMRYSENLLIAFDGDRAGVAAAGRAASIALAAGLNVKIVAMPEGEDPADMIRRDLNAWKQSVREALHVIDFYLSDLMKAGHDVRRLKLEVSRVVLPYVAEVRNAIDQAHFIQRIAETIQVPEDAVRAELKKLTTVRPLDRTSAFDAPSFSLERLLAGLKEETGDRASIVEADLFLEQYPGEREDAVAELEAALAKREVRDHYQAIVMHLKAAEHAGDAPRIESLMQELAALAKTL